MLKTIAFIYGIIFVVIGIMGFIPKFAPHHHLLGIFHINPLHNIIHLVTGIAGFWVCYTSQHASRIFFQVFGVIYGIVTILGFIAGNKEILGLIANNQADNVLHLIVAILSLYLGFGVKLKRKK
jgi:hypothetical protein